MAVPFTGGCACGAVRYECSAEPVMAGNCHCRDCQRASGGPFAPVVIAPKAAVKITGAVKYYEVKGDSGNAIRRGFCPNCGSPLFGMPSGLPMELVSIRAASLDDPSWYRPAMDIYTASAQPWDHMNPDIPKFPKMPPMS
jgi:hypothetical protein